MKEHKTQERNTFQDIPREIKSGSEEDFKLLKNELKDRTVVIDMGCGHGDYLIEHTVKRPECLFLGIEIARKRVLKTSSRLAKRGINNYYVIHSPGDLALSLLLPEESVDEIHVNFPDPWLRKRQWKGRIFRPSFLMQISRVLKKGGKLHFVSDVAEYAEQVAALLLDFPYLTNVYEQPIHHDLFESFPTLFYRRMSPLRKINYICFEKHK